MTPLYPIDDQRIETTTKLRLAGNDDPLILMSRDIYSFIIHQYYRALLRPTIFILSLRENKNG